MGRVGGAYGVRGWVRIDPLSQHPHALLAHARWWLRRADDMPWQPYATQEARAHGGAVVASLEGVASREAAAALRGAQVGVARADLPEPEPGEVYSADLEGLAVINREGVPLGRVAGFLDTGAHPVLRVARTDGGAERLIPWVPVYVDDADLAAGVVHVDWPADE
jgi:16S rRNA processing protein RimM